MHLRLLSGDKPSHEKLASNLLANPESFYLPKLVYPRIPSDLQATICDMRLTLYTAVMVKLLAEARIDHL